MNPNHMNKFDLIRGALVADAASLGAHWIYDKARVAEVCGETPEFLEPDVQNYRGGAGYFAAKGKRAGDSSHPVTSFSIHRTTPAEMN